MDGLTGATLERSSLCAADDGSVAGAAIVNMESRVAALLSQARNAVLDNRFLAAGRLLQEALQLDPQRPAPWLMLAQLAMQTGNHRGAVEAAQRAVERAPGDADAWYTLARAHKTAGALAAAIDGYRRSLTIAPASPDVLTSLGVALRASGRLAEAVEAYRAALRLAPDHVLARNNLANALAAIGEGSAEPRELRAAVRSHLLERTASLHREAVLLRNNGRQGDARLVIQEALQIAPGDVELLIFAAELASDLGRGSESLAYFDRAHDAAPEDWRPLEAARRAALVAGLTDRGRRYADLVMRLRPSDEVRLSSALALPAIAESRAAIARDRSEYQAALDRYMNEELSVSDPFGLIGTMSFRLAYHGENDRELQIKAARLFQKAMPSLVFTAPHCRYSQRRPGRLRIGILSRFLYRHSIARTTMGLVEQIDRRAFEVYLIRLAPSPDDATTARMRAAADQVIEVDIAVGLERARERLAALELDILFYQDIGMEPASYFLSFARLAPIQCMSFGHPNTSGVPNVDYFVSNSQYETEASCDHYSERLFILEDLPTLAYYYRPERGAQHGDRAAYGLPTAGTLYMCPQALFKLHPDFDALIGGILEGDRTGRVILVRGPGCYEEWVEALRSRFARTLPQVADRVLFVEGVASDAFLGFLSHGDVVLDTMHFNGMNSSLESFAVGLPVVTLPTSLQRGRHTQAMYRSMGITELIARDAEEYVRIAVRLGTDRSYNRSMRELILARNSVLFEDARVVREFERFFLAALKSKAD
jgi:protein O-GlcNAc transferase